jgi:hypothetical protein
VDAQHSLPDESQVNWFQADRGPADPDHLPAEPRVAAGRGARHAEGPDDQTASTLHSRLGPVGPRSGQPLPPLPPELMTGGSTQEHPQYHPQSVDRDTLHRARGGLLRLGDGVYRGRKPALAASLAVLAVLFEVAFIRVFVHSFRTTAVGGTIASTLMIIALPMFALGMYALAGGAAVTPGQGVRAWLRTPLAYLPLGLILFLAAALAA